MLPTGLGDAHWPELAEFADSSIPSPPEVHVFEKGEFL